MSWWRNIESRLDLQAIIVLHQLALLKDIWKAQFLGFIKLKGMIQLLSLQICLETLSIYIHLRMETEEFIACFDADEMLSVSSKFKLLS